MEASVVPGLHPLILVAKAFRDAEGWNQRDRLEARLERELQILAGKRVVVTATDHIGWGDVKEIPLTKTLFRRRLRKIHVESHVAQPDRTGFVCGWRFKDGAECSTREGILVVSHLPGDYDRRLFSYAEWDHLVSIKQAPSS